MAGAERLTLRPWRLTDADAIRAAFAPPEMSRQTSEPVDSESAARRWLHRREQQWQEGSAYSWAVAGRSGEVVGQVAVSALDRRNETGWVSYWTVPAARGRGVAAAAVRAAAQWAFDRAGLFRLELGHRTDNPASCRVATAAGFLVEGLERQKLCYEGQRFDVELHARLATDPGA
ncbi:GNAT family N-acetyltransferase [Natronosporangium hydrolyticum]|uniref:GNAT family N-acetyltransferase n=2 Tax=Natronosporangium hydrolyticum TaxID=2811111 RepID=A0A895YGP1_9ACTN|nr:GNAT family N-acetyltransferase [Natronosporangium hydrolyticum]